MLLAVQQTLHGEQHSRPHMSSTLSPEQASQRVGLSRWTVSRALQAGRLRGVRDNRGRWRIEAEDLDAWLAAQPPAQASTTHSDLLAVQHTPDNEQAHRLLTTEVAVLKARLEAFEGRAAELERDRDEARSERDRWRQMAERLSEGNHLPPPVPKPSGGFLARLLG